MEDILIILGIGMLLLGLAFLYWPTWFFLIFLIPVTRILAGMFKIGSILSIGGADVEVADLLLVLLYLKHIFWESSNNQSLMTVPIPTSLLCFICMLILSTLTSFFRFGSEVFLSETTALLRLIAELGCFLLIFISIKKPYDLENSSKTLQIFGLLVGMSIYLNVLLFLLGIEFGEVSSNSEFNRFFGVLGDSVKSLLPFFIYQAFLNQQKWMTIFLLGAILITGGLVGIFALIGGFIIMFKKNFYVYFKKYFGIVFFMLLVVAILLSRDVGGITTRLMNLEEQASLYQRIITINLSLQVFWDNLLLGVGFTGFRFAVTNYEYNENIIFFPKLPKDMWFDVARGVYGQPFRVGMEAGIFGLIFFTWMIVDFIKIFQQAKNNTTSNLSNFFEAGKLWFFSLLITSIIVAWILPKSLISYNLWIILGLSLKVNTSRANAVKLIDNKK